MIPSEVRFAITRAMDRQAGVVGVIVHDPTPGQPLSLDVITNDPFTPKPDRKAERRYRITIEEIT